MCDFNHTLAELAHEAAKYHDLAPRLWGPQEVELGDESPTSFRERIRLLRKQLHDDADAVDGMDQNQLRDRLEQEGHASTGASREEEPRMVKKNNQERSRESDYEPFYESGATGIWGIVRLGAKVAQRL